MVTYRKTRPFESERERLVCKTRKTISDPRYPVSIRVSISRFDNFGVHSSCRLHRVLGVRMMMMTFITDDDDDDYSGRPAGVIVRPAGVIVRPEGTLKEKKTLRTRIRDFVFSHNLVARIATRLCP